MSKRVRTERIGLRLTVEERDAIVNAAKIANQDITEFLIRRALAPQSPAKRLLARFLGIGEQR